MPAIETVGVKLSTVLRSEQNAVSSISAARALGSGAGFVDGTANPLSYAMEASLILEGERLHNWYRDTRYGKIYYAYSDDRDSNIWTIGNGGVSISDTNADLSGSEMPYVQKVGDTYYMIANQDYSLRLLSSTDKIHWTYADGGTPVLSKSSTPTDWNYRLYNPGFCVVGDEWHLLIEASAQGGNFTTHYSHATFTNGTVNFNANVTALPVLSGITGNPFLVYVPDRASILALYGEIVAGVWVLRAVTALLSANLSLAASWVAAPGFGKCKSGVHLADPTLVFSDGTTKSWKCLLMYNYAQETGYSAYCQLSLNELFDAVKDPSTPEPCRLAGTIETDRLDFSHYGQNILSRNAAGFLTNVSSSGILELIKNDTPTKSVQIRANGDDLLIHTGCTAGTLSSTYITVKSNGYIGIAVSTESIAAPLHARRNGGANQLVARFDNPGGNAYVELVAGATKCVQFWTTGAGDFALYTGATPGTVGTQRIFVNENGGVRIGGTGAVAASALVDIRSTTQGILPPRMTTAQRDAISSPAESLIIYNLTTHKLCCYDGTSWQDCF